MREWPPVWLGVGLLIAWFFAQGWGPMAVWAGWALIAGGVALMLAAIITMIRARTTPIPNRDPDALVTTGPFAISRNPIYLADAIILAGASLAWGSLIGLLFVPTFGVIINRRFIKGEEARLAAAFGEAFETYREKTPRWIGPI